MDYLEALRILVWPALILATVLIFRKQVNEMIKNIADFSITKDGFSARVGKPQLLRDTSKSDESEENTKDNKYFSKANSGEVIFDYSNNNGVYTIGENESKFDTQWSKASNEYIHFYNDQPTIKSVRLAKDISDLDKVRPEKYDASSRARTVGKGQIAIFENIYGKFLAVKVISIKDDSRGDEKDEIRFTYKILS